jgi:hypothetical protein
MDPDLDPHPTIFVPDLQDANKKPFKFFCPPCLHFEGTGTPTFTLILQDKKSFSHITVGIKAFLSIFA